MDISCLPVVLKLCGCSFRSPNTTEAINDRVSVGRCELTEDADSGQQSGKPLNWAFVSSRHALPSKSEVGPVGRIPVGFQFGFFVEACHEGEGGKCTSEPQQLAASQSQGSTFFRVFRSVTTAFAGPFLPDDYKVCVAQPIMLASAPEWSVETKLCLAARMLVLKNQTAQRPHMELLA